MAITLAIDTAAPRLGLGLLLADGLADTLVEDVAKGHAEILFDRLAGLLARNGLAYADLERIAVTTGPGSFTGLRIGLAAARGLGLTLDIPVLGIPSLLAISLSGRPGEPVAVLLDARRGETYVQRFVAPGEAAAEASVLPTAMAEAGIALSTHRITSPFCDMALLAGFAAIADPSAYPPEASYIRDADAKPQERGRIARLAPGEVRS